ncbi:MAG TPA: choice-of-anchor Q domain-containing protein, partial [Anaerolineales bacterium]|nr:choice-of-anchor Q domain-containing protein [Anaerolineales bacterium]
VTKTADTNDGVCNSDCSLREAITTALDGTTINFNVSGTITLGSALPAIDKMLSLDGSGQSITVDGADSYHIFEVSDTGDLRLNRLTITNGNAVWGGGISNSGVLTLRNSTVSGNSSTYGGGITNFGVLTVLDSTISGNTAVNDGGGIYNDGGTYLGGGIVTLTNTEISNNTSPYGGGIYTRQGMVAITNGTFSNNSADTVGGGIYNFGTLTVSNSTFYRNSASEAGGIYHSYMGTVTLTGSTFLENSATNYGGAIYNDASTFEITNSTLKGNSANFGGGIYNNGSFIGTATLTLTNATLAGNSGTYGGGIYNMGTLNYTNTILANSTVGVDCYNSEWYGVIGINSNNLVKTNGPTGHTCGVPTVTGDPVLGPLAGNGGSTQTMALLSGSPAIDAGNEASCPATDQRGVTRPQPAGGACDIGAYEYTDATAPTVTMSSTAPEPTNTSPIPVTVQFSESVTGFLATDITVTGGTLDNFLAVDGDTYTFDLTPGGQGAVTADIAQDAAVDASGNGNVAAPQFSRTYDTVSPIVTINRAAGENNPTNAASVNFTVTFSEPVSGVDVTAPFDDFTLAATGVTGAAITSVSGSGSTYTVTVNTGSGNGTLRLDVPVGATITDAVGNLLGDLPYTNGQEYTIDKTPGAGIYDDRHARWTFSNGWTNYNGTGPYSNTSRYTNVVGSQAQFTFNGMKFTFTYLKAHNRGLIDVYVDGSKIAQINAKNSTTAWQQTWTSPVLTPGVHTVRFVHAGGGTYIDVDAIQIFTPLDTVAPAAISDLAAAGGTTTGAMDLNWTAPGDDGSTGTASSYLVRYSTTAIDSADAWNTATPVTTGIPIPAAAGSPESMSVSGLTPGATYFFAVRALDEEENLGSLSNSPSAAAQNPVPVTTGSYDDTDINWLYTGSWTSYTGTGPANKTSHYANTVGSAAQITIEGAKFKLTYLKAHNRGLIDVYVDGSKIAQINAKSSSTLWQQTWTSPILTPGVHVVRFVHAGGGTYIDIDKIQVFDAPPAVPAGDYDDADAAWVFSTGWTTYAGTGPVNNTNHYTNLAGSDAQLVFTGTGFTFTYVEASNRGLIDVYVDGVKIDQINAKSSPTAWQQVWSSPTLSAGVHIVRFVHAGGGTYIDVDTITILP